MKETQEKWRLLRTQPSIGAWNMAVDEAILEFTAQGISPPTLRLYSWSPACLSLGYAQTIEDVDLVKLKKNGWDIVRRPTGGRAILHMNELTYSICGMSSNSKLAGSVLESYRRLSQALIRALQIIDINADLPKLAAKQDSIKTQNPVCFEMPSNYEITFAGKKLIGSAQARKNSGVLQHGTLPLFGDITRIIDVLRYPDELQKEKARLRLLKQATTVESVLGYPGDWWITAHAFEHAFKQVLNIEIVRMDLSPEEGLRAHALFNEKYNNSEWTTRR
jgi:lipoate-protein ligase A